MGPCSCMVDAWALKGLSHHDFAARLGRSGTTSSMGPSANRMCTAILK